MAAIQTLPLESKLDHYYLGPKNLYIKMLIILLAPNIVSFYRKTNKI